MPILAVLQDHLLDLKLARRWDEGLVFGTSPTHPFEPSAVRRRAMAAWRQANIAPIGLHECRHTCASIFIAAGVNARTLSTIMGHASITITFDRYGHLMPGSESEVAALVDAYPARADTEARLAQLEATGSR